MGFWDEVHVNDGGNGTEVVWFADLKCWFSVAHGFLAFGRVIKTGAALLCFLWKMGSNKVGN